MNRQTFLIAALLLGACGPAPFPFIPSNVSGEQITADGSDLIFDAANCGPRAVIDGDLRTIDCFRPGVFSPSFSYEIQYVAQTGGPELAMVVGRNIHIGPDTEVQLKGTRPVVLAAYQRLTVEGALTAQDPILKYKGQAGGASEPDGNGAGSGAGGGQVALSGTGAGGGSYCGVGGRGGDDTDPVNVGAVGGTVYGNQPLIPLLAGSSGGKNGNHAGAGGGAVHLLAGERIDISGYVNMGGRGGGWFGNGGGSGGAVLIEAPTVNISGDVAANGGGGGGGASGGGEDGADAAAESIAAEGGYGGAGGGDGGNGSSGTSLNGEAGANGTTGGGGGGGAGRIRINTETLTLVGTVSPAPGACMTEGALTAAE